ncbi:MAG: FHIPEP family type III secretion protein [Acidobacteria bacterium]|nr:FHIPEP family type III secretion protein [Acidobacteriota bacterium]
MSEQTVSKSPRQSLADFVESIEASQDPEKELLEHTIERAKAKHPELGEALRYCAIPRRFDAEIIGAMRDAPDDLSTNEYLLSELTTFSFVLTRRDGGYVYHDNVRDSLLKDWQGENDRDKFDQYNWRLVSFYRTRHEEARRIELDWMRVAGIVQGANPARYTQLASLVETRLVAPLLEALYHEMLRSVDDGYDFFTRYCFEYEETRRLTICESLLNATRSYIETLPPDDRQQNLLNWLRYWEARISRQLGRYADAERINRDLLDRIINDPRLKLWAMDEFGVDLQSQEKLDEAKMVFTDLLKLSIETREDPYNLPLFYSRLASLHSILDEPGKAAELYEQTLRASQDVNNRIQEAYAHLDLGGVFQNLGEWEKAINTAFEACRLVRRQLPVEVWLHQTMIDRIRSLIARRDPRLLDTLYIEARTLLTARSDTTQTLQLYIDYFDQLRQSGQLSRAEQFFKTHQKELENSTDPNHYPDYLLRHGLLMEAQGRTEETAADYQAIIELAKNGRASDYYYAVALHYLGESRTALALYSDAEADFVDARSRWERMGRKKLVADTDVSAAAALRCEGRFDSAQKLLDNAREALGDATPSYLATLHRIQGHIYRDQGQWEKARDEYIQSVSIQLSLSELSEAAETLASLAMVFSTEGNRKEAAHYATEAGELWRRLAESNEYKPSEAMEKADAENAQGVQFLYTSDSERRDNLRSARDHFNRAIELAPDNVWYYLNLADAYAEFEEWLAAAEAIELALKHGPPWMPVSVLQERLAEYHCKQGEALSKQGDRKFALEAFKKSQEWLEKAREASCGQFNLLAESRIRLGDGLLQMESLEDAQANYQAGLELATDYQDIAMQAASHARLGFIAAILNRLDSAAKHFSQYISTLAGGIKDDIAKSLIDECVSLIRDTHQYRLFNAALRSLSADPTFDPPLRRQIIAARFGLISSRHNPTAPPSDKTLVVTQIAIEAEDSLFPHGDDWWGTQKLFESYIPAMQDRIEAQMGIRVPSVPVHTNKDELPQHTYLLIINSVPMVMGTLYPELKFCPNKEAVESILTEDSDLKVNWEYNPLTESFDGAWIPEKYWEKLGSTDSKLWDIYEYMVRHLEKLVRSHLTSIFGLQEATDLLERWQNTGDIDEINKKGRLIELALPDLNPRLRFVQVLQSLLREYVPIRDIQPILETFSQPDLRSRDFVHIVENVRMKLRDQLPGNDLSHKFLQLSPAFENEIKSWIWERDGKSFFAIPPEETQELLSAVRVAIDQEPQDKLALMTEADTIRPFVRRLIELEFPRVDVLSSRELLPELRDKSTGVVEYEPEE